MDKFLNFQWIDIEEKKPKKDEDVLLYCTTDDDIIQNGTHEVGHTIAIGFISEVGKFHLSNRHLDDVHSVSHWMPLPTAPQVRVIYFDGLDDEAKSKIEEPMFFSREFTLHNCKFSVIRNSKNEFVNIQSSRVEKYKIK